ncbi:hypothetical protein NT05HA_2239 [Aggregatibacter aphrophilus NJ8700]|nr:hypothetical protein NT05HA_2239 [Aggregatibacter aphrophilus NJ8700]
MVGELDYSGIIPLIEIIPIKPIYLFSLREKRGLLENKPHFID